MFFCCVLMLPSVLSLCFCPDSKDKAPGWDVFTYASMASPTKICVGKLVAFGSAWCKPKYQALSQVRLKKQSALCSQI